MKRFAWLLLAVWCTALAQVQPVRPVALVEHDDCCCDCDGTCGMPECVLPPAAPATPTAIAERPATVARPAARRDTPATDALLEKFHAVFSAPAMEPAAVPVPADAAPPASVPLFKEHCALLI